MALKYKFARTCLAPCESFLWVLVESSSGVRLKTGQLPLRIPLAAFSAIICEQSNPIEARFRSDHCGWMAEETICGPLQPRSWRHDLGCDKVRRPLRHVWRVLPCYYIKYSLAV